MAAPSSSRSLTFEIPTEEPRFAGLTKTGYFNSDSICFLTFFASASHRLRNTVTCFTMGSPAAEKSRFITSLSIPAAEPRTPAPT